VGGGVGAALGLAAAATPTDDRSAAPAAAGFAAWGAWVGSFSGSLVHNDPHEIVLGGLLGANAGFLAGYGLLSQDVVEPRDFGWLSLFGALGTVAGAGVAAPFSGGSSTAIRAGLAVGPAVGMIAGALVLPRLRKAIASNDDGGPTGATRARRHPAAGDTEPETAEALDSGGADVGRPRSTDASDPTESTVSRRLAQVGAVTDWAPLVGALPASPDTGPAPVLFGLTGHWK
jgi:hypothetical protein